VSKKRIITAVSLVVVLALLVVVFILLSGDESPETGNGSRPNDESFVLINVEPDEIERIRKRTDDFEFTLVFDGEAWSVLGDDIIRLDQSLVRRFVRDASFIASNERAAEDEIYFAQWGLAEPQGVIELILHNGEIHTLMIGNRAHGAQAAYFVNTGANQNNIYVLSQARVSALMAPIDDIRDRQISSMSEEDITYVHIDRTSGTDSERISFRQRSAEEMAAEYASMGIPTMVIPAWRMTSPMDVNANDDTVNDIVFSLGTLRISRFADDVSLTAAGLNNPEYIIEFGDGAGRTVRLHIGRRYDANLSFARIYPNSQIFKLNNSDISFVDANIRELINRMLHMALIDDVDMVRVTSGDEEWELSITHRANADNIYRLNGQTIPRNQFIALYREIIEITIDGAAPTTIRDLYRPVSVRIEYHYNNGRTTDVIAFRELNDRFYLIDFNGNTQFTAEIRTVQLMLDRLRD